MSFKRKTAWLAAAASVLQLLSVQALAADTQEDDRPGVEDMSALLSSDEVEAFASEAGEIYPVLDEEELSALVKAYMEEHGMTEETSAVSFYYTGTDETWSFNGDMMMVGASLFKLPLIMNLARKVWLGEMQQTDKLFYDDYRYYDLDISDIERRCLTYSDNELSDEVILYFFPFRSYRMMLAETAGYREEDLPEEYFENNVFSANFMMGVLWELYNHSEQYPNVLECLLDANQGEYFRRSLEGKYTVAQKYGWADKYMHTSAIIYTPVPCLVTVMTYDVPDSENAIAGLGALLADYAVTLNRRTREHYADLARQAEEALRAEEEARLAAEAAEQERLRQEEEARRMAEEEAARQAAEQARLEEEQARQEAERLETIKTSKIIVIGVAGLLGGTVCLYAVSRVLRRRREKAEEKEIM